MKATRTTRRAFYRALDAGCGTAHTMDAYGNSYVVVRLDAPQRLDNGQWATYDVTCWRDYGADNEICHWRKLATCEHGALAIVSRVIGANLAPDVQPIWYPFAPRAAWYYGIRAVPAIQK